MNKKELAVNYAMNFIGVDYKWGGETAHGFDCSGFVQEILKSVGLDPKGDQTANALYEIFKEKSVKYPSKAVLAFWPKTGIKTHIAMCIDDELIIEAGGGNSTTTNPVIAEKQRAFVRVRTLDNRGDDYALLDVFNG